MTTAAKPGKTFEKTNLYHSDLVRHGPLTAIVTGNFQKYGANDPEVAYIEVPGDQRYGIRLEEGSEGYVAAWKDAPRNVQVVIHAAGNGRENKATVIFLPVEQGEMPLDDREPQKLGSEVTTEASATPETFHSSGGGPGKPADETRKEQAVERRATPRPTGPEVFPYADLADRYGEALRGARTVLEYNFLIPEELEGLELMDLEMRIAATLQIAQERLQRDTGRWIPFTAEDGAQTPAERPSAAEEPAEEEEKKRTLEPPQADKGRMAALEQLYKLTFLELQTVDPKKGLEARGQIESFLREGGDRAIADKMIQYLTGMVKRVDQLKAEEES